MVKPTGYAIPYVSQFDGTLCVAVVTTRSENEKTGDSYQVWYLRADIEPHTARKEGEDTSICGWCPYASGQGCYVRAEQAPLSIYRKWRRGGYPALPENPLPKRQYRRQGAYGDPASAPLWVFNLINYLFPADKDGAYTHFWESTPELRGHCMASVDNPTDYAKAHEAGWRTFRVRPRGSALLPGETECLSTRGLHCNQCGLCYGAGAAKSISIEAHGAKAHLTEKVCQARPINTGREVSYWPSDVNAARHTLRKIRRSLDRIS